MLLPEVEGELAEIPDFSSKGMLASFDPPVEKSIKAVFGQLRHAGVNEGQKVESWSHFVRPIQEGLTLESTIILGGRDYAVGLQRGAQAMRKTDRKAASELVYLIRPTWNHDNTPRDNFAAVRKAMEIKVPAFAQAMLTELDAHTAQKLNQLQQFGCIVAVVMMIHMDGIQHELKEQGWEQVETW